jgi:anthranilate/para-aminobenzoate synthase component I
MARLEGRELTVRPIAGTRPRGTDEKQDHELE